MSWELRANQAGAVVGLRAGTETTEGPGPGTEIGGDPDHGVEIDITGDAAEVVIVEGPEAEKGGGEVEAGRDLVVGEERGLAPEIRKEKKEIQRRKRKSPTNRRTESLRISRPKMGRMAMELMGWRLQRRKGPGPRAGLVEDLEAETDAVQNPEIGADPDQNLEKDPNDPDPEIEDGDPEAGREGGAEVSQDVGHDLGITRARRAREIVGPLIGRRRGPG